VKSRAVTHAGKKREKARKGRSKGAWAHDYGKRRREIKKPEALDKKKEASDNRHLTKDTPCKYAAEVVGNGGATWKPNQHQGLEAKQAGFSRKKFLAAQETLRPSAEVRSSRREARAGKSSRNFSREGLGPSYRGKMGELTRIRPFGNLARVGENELV